MRFIYTKSFAIFVAVIALTVLLVFFQQRGWLEPLQYIAAQAPRPVTKITTALFKPVKNFVTTLYRLRDITKENGYLTSRVQELQQEVIVTDQYRLENEQLRRELGFVKSSSLKLVPCTVLSRDPQGVTDSIILSCAEKDGIKSGQAVISNGFLVAKVVLAGNVSSTAQLITHPKASVDARLSKSGTEGVVRGSFGSGLIFEAVTQNSTIEGGDMVVTAGIDGIIPKNIAIGEVRDIISKENDLSKQATLASPVNFRSVDLVFVATQ